MTQYISRRFMSSLRRRGVPAGHIEDGLADPKPTGLFGVERQVRGVVNGLFDGHMQGHRALDFSTPRVSALGAVAEKVVKVLDIGLVDLEADISFAHERRVAPDVVNRGGQV